MLDRERADFFRVAERAPERALPARRRDPSPDRRGARAHRGRRPPPHVRVHEPRGAEGGQARRDPGGAGRPGRGVPREAPRLRGRDRRGVDGALPRRPGALRRGGRPRAQGRRHPRRDLPGRVRRRHEEPRDDRGARPARGGRPLAREEGLRRPHRGRRQRGVRVQDRRRPVRRPDQRLPRPRGVGEVATRRS